MKFIVTADWHLTNANSKFRLNKQGVSDLLTAQENFAFHLAHSLEQDDSLNGLIFCGDWTNESTLNPIVQHYSNRIARRLAETGKKIILLQGNHTVSDARGRHTVLGAMEELSSYDNVLFITKTGLHELNIGNQTLRLHCFPYHSDYEKIEEDIAESNRKLNPEERGEDTYDVMLFHFPTKNAMLDNGMPSSHGVNLDYSITKNFNVCFGGDFHKPQRVNRNSHYVGAPFDLKFGEHEQRGYIVADMDDGYVVEERFDNPFQYAMIKCTAEEFFGNQKELFKKADRAIIRIIGGVTPEQLQTFQEIKKDFYQLTHPLKTEGQKVEVKVEVAEEGEHRDIDLIKKNLEGVNKKVFNRAVKIFEEISN